MTPTRKEYSNHQDEQPETLQSEQVVISGISGLFPESNSVKELSHILYNKINPVTDENPRWNFQHPDLSDFTGKVPKLDRFDAQFFKVHSRLGNNMDSMSRKILEQAYQAIYDAGVSPEHLSGKNIGVYVGTCFSETEKAAFYVASSRTGLGIAGCNKSMFANRISYWLNVKGPSMSIDESCCSSIAALEQAYLAMSRGDCEAALVGGAYLCLHPQSLIHHSRIMRMCKDGKMKSFDQNADGCAKSETIGVLFLQKAKDALRAYAEILHIKSEYAEILRGEIGPEYGFHRDPMTTVHFLNNFYSQAKVSPSYVEYVEAFGSAVPEADKSELEAIDQVFCNKRNAPLPVGSVMSNIGYAEAASGISAITKVLLGYETGLIAGNLHLTTPRHDVSGLRDGRIQVITDHCEFNRTYVGVNALSITGVNAHVLLHGRYKRKDLNRYRSSIPRLVTLSGRQESAVKNIMDDLKSRPVDPEELALLYNIHETKISGHMARGFIIIDTKDQKTVSLTERVEYFDEMKRPLWFVYSGMGSQWPGMGEQLMRIPIFAAAIERCRVVLEPRGIDLVQIITSRDKSIFDNILHSFVGIAAVQIGLTDILRELGLEPDNIIGHSVGELGCAYADGCLTAEEMILAAYSRGLVSIQTPLIRGSMAAVGLGYREIKKICPPEIEVACHNGSQSCTISGPENEMRTFVADLTARGIFAREVPCSNIAYHSRYIADAGPELLKYMLEVIKKPKLRSDKWLSTSVPQEKWNEPSAKFCSAEYFTNNLLNPVLFEETSALVPSNAVLVEIAPHGLLQAILKRSLKPDCRHIGLTRRGHPDNALLLLEAVGKLYLNGYMPKVNKLYPEVEFPVSTGTPMLSHQVEWVHNEKWVVPLYSSADRIAAASCKFIISTHDQEHKYLRGNVIRGKTVYPFAAVLVSVWDTLGMVLKEPKRETSVVFSDIHFYVQPVLHDQRQLKLSVSIHRGSGQFEVLDEMSKVATGFIVSSNLNMHSVSTINEDMDLTGEDIYELLNIMDYSYSGDFKTIHSANVRLSQAMLEWKGNWVTFIDGMLQLHALRQTHEGVSQPRHIRKLCINCDNHLKLSSYTDGKTLINVEVSDILDSTRCAGVSIENIKYRHLSLQPKQQVKLNRLKFIPHFDCNLDDTTAIYAYLKIVTESLNKNVINVVGITSNNGDLKISEKIKNIIRYIPNVVIQYRDISINEVLRDQDQLASDLDLIVVEKLSMDDEMSQVLNRILHCDAFILNDDSAVEVKNTRPTALYRQVCVAGNLQLLRWQPASTNPLGSASTDICNGGYYVPWEKTQKCNERILLENSTVGDLESLRWVGSLKLDGPGIKVKVHYAGIHKTDILKATGENPYNHENVCDGFGMDFSGVTESGERVMGIVLSGACSSHVLAQPELLWPVPEHWSLEDAATVPLVYMQAFYCLANPSICYRIARKGDYTTILVHGGDDSVGQAIISVALGFGFQVFTTVSDVQKKQFLLKLFPKLKDENIGNSRDTSFGDMILSSTNGVGCDMVITCVKDDLKNISLNCCAFSGLTVDTTVGAERETFNLGLANISRERSYVSVDFRSILINNNFDDIKQLQKFLNDGIVSGFVRPLSRITYSSNDATRAFRLMEAGQNQGKVLLRLDDPVKYVEPRFDCEPDSCNLLICDRGNMGLQLADKLISRGAKNIYLHYTSPPSYLQYKIRQWRKFGVEVNVSFEDLAIEINVSDLVLSTLQLGPLEGLYIISLSGNVGIEPELINHLDALSRKHCSTLRHFTVVSGQGSVGLETCMSRINDKYPVLKLNVEGLQDKADDMDVSPVFIREIIEVIESAVNENDLILALKFLPERHMSIVKQIATVADVVIDEDKSECTLKQLGINNDKSRRVAHFLRNNHSIAYDQGYIESLTVQELTNLEKIITETNYDDTTGLAIFFSHVDSDELQATAEIVSVSTLTKSLSSRDDEFDTNQAYLCIIPGLEGHYKRFCTLSERLKLNALVLQPGLDKPYETIQELADRYTEILLKNMKFKNTFTLLGFEFGVIVALEVAQNLEKQGLQGTVFCIGYDPDGFKQELDKQLNEYGTDEQLQGAVVRHMYQLMAGGNTTGLEEALKNAHSWTDKLDACVRTLLGRVSHSAQYARGLIEAAFGRIKQVKCYSPGVKPLRSKLVLMRAATTAPLSSEALSRLSLQPVEIHDLTAPLLYATEDLRCTAIINHYLPENVLQDFENRNLCENYLLNAETYMMHSYNVNI